MGWASCKFRDAESTSHIRGLLEVKVKATLQCGPAQYLLPLQGGGEDVLCLASPLLSEVLTNGRQHGMNCSTFSVLHSGLHPASLRYDFIRVEPPSYTPAQSWDIARAHFSFTSSAAESPGSSVCSPQQDTPSVLTLGLFKSKRSTRN